MTTEKIEKSSKKAVIASGGRQYIVSVGDEVEVNHLPAGKSASFDVLALVDGANTKVGLPLVDGAKVTADVIEQTVKAEKVTAIRYKAKKRVKKIRGHRQLLTRIKVTKIAA